MPDLLAIENLRAGYGEAVVLPDMSLRLAEGEVLALLGRNGTGKTTLINSIVGVTRRFGGKLALAGRDITAMRPDQRARAGIGWVPQERNIFRSLTVEENMTAVAQDGIAQGSVALRIEVRDTGCGFDPAEADGGSCHASVWPHKGCAEHVYAGA